ncbi:MAG: phytanoyl-CoA dioxygenase family protein [Pseudomonadota bacterium]
MATDQKPRDTERSAQSPGHRQLTAADIPGAMEPAEFARLKAGEFQLADLDDGRDTGELHDYESIRVALQYVQGLKDRSDSPAMQHLARLAASLHDTYSALQREAELTFTEIDRVRDAVADIEEGREPAPEFGPVAGGHITLNPVEPPALDEGPLERIREVFDEYFRYAVRAAFDAEGSNNLGIIARDLSSAYKSTEQRLFDLMDTLDEETERLQALKEKTGFTAAAKAPPRQAADSYYTLSPEQVDFFNEHGYLGPLDLCSEADMARIRRWVDRAAFLDGRSPIFSKGPPGRVLRDWHLVHPEIFELCAHPAIVERMAAIMGPDLVLWRSQFMWKGVGGKPVAWHQDGSFPGGNLKPALNPARNISAWIALDEATIDNGCVRVVPGTHRQELQYHGERAQEREGLFGRGYRLVYSVDTKSAVPLVMKPGQFFLFNESCLHGSTTNLTDRRRLGLAVRCTTPDVRIYEGQDEDGQGYPLDKFASVLVRGEDTHGHNRMQPPPVTADGSPG